MSDLQDYLVQKRAALQARKLSFEAGSIGASKLKARVTAEGRSGVRRIRIRDFQVISDSPPDFAGYDLGPSSPELQLGVLGSCLTHSYEIQAALLQIPLQKLDVELSAVIDPRAGSPGHEATPVFPHNIAFTVNIVADVSAPTIEELRANVERTCPILNLLRNPQTLTGSIAHTRTQDGEQAAA